MSQTIPCHPGQDRYFVPNQIQDEGEVAKVEDGRPKKPVAKSMMEALRETAESL